MLLLMSSHFGDSGTLSQGEVTCGCSCRRNNIRSTAREESSPKSDVIKFEYKLLMRPVSDNIRFAKLTERWH